MGQKNPEKTPDGKDRAIKLLTVEYEQAGEEIRYRDKILHNSYYLLIIILGVFVGNLFNHKQSVIAFIAISTVAGVAFAFLGFVVEVYFRRRESAMVRRGQVEDRIQEMEEELFNLQNGLYQEPFQGGGDSSGRKEKSWIEQIGPHTVASLTICLSACWLIISTIYVLHFEFNISWILSLTGIIPWLIIAFVILRCFSKNRPGHYKGKYL